MATLDSILTDYEDNAAYEENGSVAEAKAFVTACRKLLTKRPMDASTRAGGVKWDMKIVQDELERARAWLRENDTAANTGATRFADLRGFRV